MHKYRTRNFIASDNRDHPTIHLHPAIVEGMKAIARRERKSLSWVAEEALSEFFGIRATLKKLKGQPKPAYTSHLKIVKKRSA